MEFEDLQKIWDAQNNQPIYVIDEQALHNRILSKKNQAYRITNVSELLLIIVNFCSGIFVLSTHYFNSKAGVMMFLLSAWMLATAIYMLVSRIRRTQSKRKFDRSMLGDLSHALHLASYQVRISQLMRWNIVPIAAFCVLGLMEGGKSAWITISVLLFFILTFYASRWEHGIYVKRKRELELLQSKLEEKG